MGPIKRKVHINVDLGEGYGNFVCRCSLFNESSKGTNKPSRFHQPLNTSNQQHLPFPHLPSPLPGQNDHLFRLVYPNSRQKLTASTQKCGPDDELIPMIDQANVACGFHAGDPLIMQETVRTCKRHHIAVGAHPGLPDIQGFGRREMKLSPEELTAMVFLPSPNAPLSAFQ